MIDAKVTIDDSAVQKVLDALDDRDLARRMANRVADEVVLPNLAKYPSPSGRKMKFKSAKQRAFVLAAIRTGDIQVPYHRTGDLSASYQKQPIPDGMALVSGLPYAEYVRGPGQAEYFKGVWDTHEQIAEKSEADAALAATAEIVQTIGDAAP